MRAPFVSAHQEYFLSKMGINSIADKRLLKRNELLDSLNQPRPQRGRQMVTIRDNPEYLTDHSCNDLDFSKNKSFSYESLASNASATPPLESAQTPATSSRDGYNSEEALVTLRQLRKKNAVDFSRFWGWEQKQRALQGQIGGGSVAGGSATVASNNINSNAALGVGKGPEKRQDGKVVQRLQAVNDMRNAYIGAQRGPIGQTSMTDSLAEAMDVMGGGVGAGGRGGRIDGSASGLRDSLVTPFELPAPDPHILTAPSSRHGQSYNGLGIGSTAATGSSLEAEAGAEAGTGGGSGPEASSDFRARKPRIADLVLTDEHFDLVSKYFLQPSPTGPAQGQARGQHQDMPKGPELGPGLGGGQAAEMFRVTGQSTHQPPIFVYSPTATGSASTSAAGQGSGSGSGRGQESEPSLDELLAFMSAAEGGL